ncbi:MAG: hypothetical protein Q8Q07_05770 [Dehalococcoidales bacterium]|nr:hypothetical protein [Dehalococcoidales bacterium]MDZ4230651.1 hypothetical protein [Dehalococcoidales bacterium]
MVGIQVLNFILAIVSVAMFITMFVVVIKIWNFQKAILRSGGYPTVSYSRAKRDAALILEGVAPWDYNMNEIIEILSRYPGDPEADDLTQRLIARKNESDRK